MGSNIMLLPKRKSFIEFDVPNVEGIVPWNLLEDTSNHERTGSSPNDDEMVPDRSFSLACKI